LLVTSIMVALVAIDGYRGEGLSLQVIKVPVAAETDFGSRVWLGITNQGTEARLLCLGGWSYRTIAGTKPMIAGGESSPHGCGSIDSFQLILSKETAYMPILIPEATRAQSLVLEFTATVVPYDLQRNER